MRSKTTHKNSGLANAPIVAVIIIIILYRHNPQSHIHLVPNRLLISKPLLLGSKQTFSVKGGTNKTQQQQLVVAAGSTPPFKPTTHSLFLHPIYHKQTNNECNGWNPSRYYHPSGGDGYVTGMNESMNAWMMSSNM